MGRKINRAPEQRHRQHGCWGQLIAAPLWIAYSVNLGTLLRSCDAVGACLAAPDTPHYHKSLDQGDTLGRGRPHIHWVKPWPDVWLETMRTQGWRIVAVELAEDATSLVRLTPATKPSVVLLGHEGHGIPDAWVEAADERVQIPMVGVGKSLNVAVAGSLVLYKLAGLS